MIEKSAFTDGSFQSNSVGSGIDVLKSASNFCHLIVSMKEIFLENFSFIAQFSMYFLKQKVFLKKQCQFVHNF